MLAKNAASRRIHIGTSGWHYQGWIGDFYPAGSKSPELLNLYLGHFRTVEVNNTFYHLPLASTLEGWRRAVPAGFRFAVKASRFITHNKKLKEGAGSFRLFFDRVKVLGPRLGPILFQLPPRWNYNGDRLGEFLASLPRGPGGPRYAFEFRHESWFNPDCYALLRKYRAGFCIYHWNDFQTPLEVTSNLVYVRFHGTRGKYGGTYPRRTLRLWAERMSAWAAEGREVWAYFNNDSEGYAPWNALTLMELVADASAGR
jgi:uncharacterized protein YecE (DUF72 family)